jgi:hypothetical protein
MLSRWGVPRWGRIIEGLEAVGALVSIVGGVCEIYFGIKRARVELAEHDHQLELIHNFGDKSLKHKAGSHCPCAPTLVCLGCGMAIEQDGAGEGEEEGAEGEEVEDGDKSD